MEMLVRVTVSPTLNGAGFCWVRTGVVKAHCEVPKIAGGAS